jgi:acyl-CoA thioester hydrolase
VKRFARTLLAPLIAAHFTICVFTPGFPKYNFSMPEFRFFHPIEVRYGDLDPQAHVNNAKYLTYMEQARIAYIQQLGLWDGRSFLEIGIILADAHITFHAPILFGQEVRVGVRVSRLGNKSMAMEYRLEDGGTNERLASGSTVLVAYDYQAARTIPIPAGWRRVIADFEQLETSDR